MWSYGGWLIVVAAIITSGCNNSSPTDSTSSVKQPLADAQVNDNEIARTARLRLSDLPADWTAGGREVDVTCAGVRSFVRRARAWSSSPRFRLGDNVQVQQTVAVYPSPGAADRAMRRLIARPTFMCIQQETRHGLLGHGMVTGAGRPVVVREDLDPYNVTGRTTRIEVPLSSDTGPIAAYLDLSVTRVGRAVAFAVAIAGNVALEDDELEAMIVPTAKRLAATEG